MLPFVADGEIDLGEVEARLQVDEETGRGLLADPGDEAQRVDVVSGHRTPEICRSVDGDDRECERRADSVRPQQRLEAGALVATDEPVERAGVFAHVVVDVEERLRARFARVDECPRRDCDPVADARDLDQQLAAR